MEENLFSEAEEMITENTPCAWKPDRKVTRERGLVCTNTVCATPDVARALPSLPRPRPPAAAGRARAPRR